VIVGVLFDLESIVDLDLALLAESLKVKVLEIPVLLKGFFLKIRIM